MQGGASGNVAPGEAVVEPPAVVVVVEDVVDSPTGASVVEVDRVV
jgi:hypothetical protein